MSNLESALVFISMILFCGATSLRLPTPATGLVLNVAGAMSKRTSIHKAVAAAMVVLICVGLVLSLRGGY